MIRQKKGVGWGMYLIIGLMVILAGIFLFAPLIDTVINVITGQGDASTCTLSLYSGRGTARCPIDNVRIFSDKVEIKKEGETDYREFMKKEPDKTYPDKDFEKEALAKLLQSCLSRGGGFNSKAFSRDEWYGGEVVCLECSQLTISDKIGTIEGFTAYLGEKGPKGSLSDKTYMELLTKDEDYRKAYMEYGWGRGLSPSDGAFKIKSEDDYTVFFLGIKKGHSAVAFDRFKRVVTYDFSNAIFKNHDTYFSFLTESRNIPEVCQRKVN